MKYSVLSPDNTGNENVKIIQHHTCRRLYKFVKRYQIFKKKKALEAIKGFSKDAGPKLNLKNRMFIERIFY